MEIAAKSILKMGNPLLREIAVLIEYPQSNEIRTLVDVMHVSMEAAGGVGLAAPQIGVPLRLIIFNVPGERLAKEDGVARSEIPQTILINPEIEYLGDEKALGWEGCLSVPGLRGLVPRHTHIRYKGLDLQGNLIERDAVGFHARVVQHEFDHLDGILYPERMDDLTKLVYESEMQAFTDDKCAPE
ncbi:MAG: peptide deformylase [Sneathiella sp.]